MITFLYRKKYVRIAESYNELTGKQLLQVCRLQRSNIEEDVARLRAMQILLQVNRVAFFFTGMDFKYRLLAYTDWIFERNTLTAQLLPVYKGYHAPAGEFDNLSLAEFHVAEINYRR